MLVELPQGLAYRVRHQIEREVVRRREWFGARGSARGACRRRDPTLPVDDAPDRELLGHVVVHVPLVVRAVLGGIGDLGEREEPDPHLAGVHRTAIVTRDVAHRRPSSSRISTSHTQLVRPRWNAVATACTVPVAHRTQEVGVVRLPERDLALGPDGLRRAHRRERLADRRVRAAVHDAHRLARRRRDRHAPDEHADLVGSVDFDAEHADEALLDGHHWFNGRVGHASDATKRARPCAGRYGTTRHCRKASTNV